MHMQAGRTQCVDSAMYIMYMLQIIDVDHLQCFHGFQSERLSLMMYMSSMAGPFNLQSFSIMLISCEFWCFRMSL